ncbi:flavin reductase family protein [Nocardioides sp. KIGAM211]|uniref:Flavin reductase family protein n=1 Tax=Nocardioides luti TaxID=2761101 RepID=A0A7X0RFV5_9ACTN|nr:flavin reductase family protein [Nocardioides luti]MBB6627531.1 flavin reductase family protein [Nocardioides luti]
MPSDISTKAMLSGMPVAELQSGFRDAFGRVAATVGVLGVRDHDGRVLGMTATAISALSNEPPSLVAMVNNQNATARLIRERKQFTVTFLAAGSEELASQLSQPGQSKVIGEEHLEHPPGWPMPVLRDVTASMACELDTRFEQFTHDILVGRITHVRTSHGPADPLLYLERRFLRLSA